MTSDAPAIAGDWPLLYDPAAAGLIAGGLTAAGVNWAGYVPCGVLHPVQQLLEANPAVTTVCGAREDEMIDWAMGAAARGRRPAVLTEASGLGWSPLILARDLAVNHLPVLLVVSHTLALGERQHWHAATRQVSDPLLQGQRIPYVILQSVGEAAETFRQAMTTIAAQGTPLAVLIRPPLLERKR